MFVEKFDRWDWKVEWIVEGLKGFVDENGVKVEFGLFWDNLEILFRDFIVDLYWKGCR